MAGWQSLSGYLQFRPGGAFGILKSKKRYWYVFEESECQLRYYKTENDIREPPLGAIDIKGAAIALSLDQSNQFIINSSGKDYFLTADNHESMMIWLLGLQAKRDAHARKASRRSSVIEHLKQHLEETSWKTRHRSGTDVSPRTDDINTHPTLSRSSSLHDRRSMFQGKEDMFTKSLDVRGMEDFAQGDNVNHISTRSRSISNESDDVFAYLHSCGDSLPHSSSYSPGGLALDTPMDHTQMYTYDSKRTSASSDSAIDSDEFKRLSEVEKNLILTKCELAKVLNREAQYKEALQYNLEMQREEKNKSSSSTVLPNFLSSISSNSKPDQKLQEHIRVLQNQNRFLNEEVKKLAALRQREEERYKEQQTEMKTLDARLDTWKHDYLYLLQSIITLPNEMMEEETLVVFGGDRHKEKLRSLLEEARQVNPGLPTYEQLSKTESHVDSYGFKHKCETEAVRLHYICTQLRDHYTRELSAYEEHQLAWKEYLSQYRHTLKVTPQLKRLCRKGIPSQYRGEVWTQLVYNQIQPIVQEKGSHYYSNLCNMLPESQSAGRYLKQISLDLMRTMPCNISFSLPTSEGIKKLRQVLQAFCVHNPQLGYCQGMNFIVAVALLFMEPEDAFWTLVAITEKYFSTNYFDQNLIGAQADQEVLKQLVKDKLPKLYAHFEELDIEICTVTLNWFLPIFFDSVPFETLLRIWDCFLLEGPKVLFRFSLAILKHHEQTVLLKRETISVMRHLKSCAKRTYDVEGLIKTAFEELKPFPSRNEITTKQVYYMNALKERIRKREMQQRAFNEREKMFEDLDLFTGDSQIIECVVQFQEAKLWLCHGHQNKARLSKLNCEEGIVYDLGIEVDSRILCACVINEEAVAIGTLGQIMYAYNTRTRDEVWHTRLNDSILAMKCIKEDKQEKIFAAQADGSVAVVENLSSESSLTLDTYYISVGQAPITALLIVNKHLWCACGNTIHILHARTLDPMDSFTISTNPYDHILTMMSSEHGVWIAVKGSSVLELWDSQQLTCKMFFDVKDNRYPNIRKEDDCYFNACRITSVLPLYTSVWVGTGDGNVHVYDIIDKQGRTQSVIYSRSDSEVSSPYFSSQGEVITSLAELEQVEDKVQRYVQQLPSEEECCYGFPVNLQPPPHKKTSVSSIPESTNSDVSQHTVVTWQQSSGYHSNQHEDLQDNNENSKQRYTSIENANTQNQNLRQFCSHGNQKIFSISDSDVSTPTVLLSPGVENENGMFTFEPKSNGLKRMNRGSTEGTNSSSVETQTEGDDVEGEIKISDEGIHTGDGDHDNDIRDMIVDETSNRKTSEICKWVEEQSALYAIKQGEFQNSSEDIMAAERKGSKNVNGNNNNSYNGLEHDGDDASQFVCQCRVAISKHEEGNVLTQGNTNNLNLSRMKVLENKSEDLSSKNGIQQNHIVPEEYVHVCNESDKTKQGQNGESSEAENHFLQNGQNESETSSETELTTSQDSVVLNENFKNKDHQPVSPLPVESATNHDESGEPKLRHSSGQSDSVSSRRSRAYSDPTSPSDSSVTDTERSKQGPYLQWDHNMGDQCEFLCSEQTDNDLVEVESDNLETDLHVSKLKKDLSSCYGEVGNKLNGKEESDNKIPANENKISVKKSNCESENDNEHHKQLTIIQKDNTTEKGTGSNVCPYCRMPRKNVTHFKPVQENRDEISLKKNNEDGRKTEDAQILQHVNTRQNSVEQSTSEPCLQRTMHPKQHVRNSSVEIRIQESPESRSNYFDDLATKYSFENRDSKGSLSSGWENLKYMRRMSVDTNLSSLIPSSPDNGSMSTLSLRDNDSLADSDFVPGVNPNQRKLSTVSISSMSIYSMSNEVPYLYDLSLQAKMKISDKPIRCLLSTRCNGEPLIISCSGCYGDDEALLKWRKEPNEKLWTNEPIIEVCPLTQSPKPASSMTYLPSRRGSQLSDSDRSSYVLIHSPARRVSFKDQV